MSVDGWRPLERWQRECDESYVRSIKRRNTPPPFPWKGLLLWVIVVLLWTVIIVAYFTMR